MAYAVPRDEGSFPSRQGWNGDLYRTFSTNLAALSF